MNTTAETLGNHLKRRRKTRPSPPKRAMVERATIERGNVIIAGNPAIARTIVGRKAAERQTKSQIG